MLWIISKVLKKKFPNNELVWSRRQSRSRELMFSPLIILQMVKARKNMLVHLAINSKFIQKKHFVKIKLKFLIFFKMSALQWIFMYSRLVRSGRRVPFVVVRPQLELASVDFLILSYFYHSVVAVLLNVGEGVSTCREDPSSGIYPTK